jgi:hypothetical protein
MKKLNGAWLHHNIKGYGLTLSASDMLKVGTRAFAENPTDKEESTACSLIVRDDSVDLSTVFVRRKAGIRTFYPDVTPDNKMTPCASPIANP